MEYWLFFLTIMAEALLMVTILDFELEVELPPALNHIFKKLNRDLIGLSNSVLGATTRKLLETDLKPSSKNKKELPNQFGWTTGGIDDVLFKHTKPAQAMDKLVQPSLESKMNCRWFPRAPVSKGYTCATHKGNIVGCATFFEHENYEYKLLCRGELYFRPKGTHTFRAGPIVPKEPGRLFVVKLDDSGLNVAVFCFEPSSRALGEVNGHAEFLPVQTSIASSQEAHGLEYTQGQGCIFDWVYGTRSSAHYPWDYNLRYDVGWMHSNPTTEELFASTDELLAECCPLPSNSQNPLRHSLEGLDSLGCFPSPDALGEIQVGFAHIELNYPDTQLANDTPPRPLPSTSSAQPTLPFPLAPAPQSEAPASSTPSANKSVLRRTCGICNRVMRRPSALTIHMNAHLGHKPFQCSDCDYSSTNITNLQRHQQTRHAGGN
ncbi:unnamed protein product [Rhizoctonia solani]|uniref:C2H2-type domain-containing protein n=1 Tax=Rhizoctonia solani TaxID=456999 RepID=A0A8H3D7E8_9AGAM|nr:unnamed protein product [Rhizoctonia solani]